MDAILLSVRWLYALLYLDVIVIFSGTQQQHIGQVHNVVTLLYIAGVTLKLKKVISSQIQLITWSTLHAQGALNTHLMQQTLYAE